jgi:hypothetical protein
VTAAGSTCGWRRGDPTEKVHQEAARGAEDASVAARHQAAEDSPVKDLRHLYEELIEFKQVTEHPRTSAGPWPTRKELGLQLDRLRVRRRLWAGRVGNATSAAPRRKESGRLSAPSVKWNLFTHPSRGRVPGIRPLRPSWSPESVDARPCVGLWGWNE